MATAIGLALAAVAGTPASSRADAAANDGLFSPSEAKALNDRLAGIMLSGRLPSVAVRVDVPGRGRYTFVRGFANIPARTGRTLAQPFRIASITKPFAATAILVLVERGLLHKTDAIARWYPAFPNADRITLDDLLRMRSGIPAPNDDQVLARVYDAPLAAAPSLPSELASYSRLRASFKRPNTIGVYTDFNYDILAGIVGRVTHKDIGRIIQETVTLPLHLGGTTYPRGSGIPGNLRGYAWNPGRKRFEDKTLFNPPLAGAAGAIVSTVGDLERFVRALCTGRLLTPAMHRDQMRGQPLAGTHANYGEGVAIGNGFCGHSGTINGFSSDMYYVRRYNATVVIDVNRLDRDNRSRSTAVLGAVTQALLRLKQSP